MSDDLRRQMLALAYRMVGSVSEAEDIVQEAFLRLEGTRDVESPGAWLTTVTTRLSIDHLRSARVRREAYPGEWLPEPMVRDPAPGPEARAEDAEQVSLALLVVLERLTPAERAVFLLREPFGYSFAEIAAILGRTEEGARQLAARARRRVEEEGPPRFEPSRERRDELGRRFLAAAEGGDLHALEELLAEDVVLWGDGGGRAPAIKAPLHGRRQVARALLGFARLAGPAGVTLSFAEVNGQPGAVARDSDGRVAAVLGLDIVDGAVRACARSSIRTSSATLGPWPTSAGYCASASAVEPPRSAIS